MLMQSAIDGFNVCVFAYGQTGSGKTYTIQGDQEKPGIVPRALEELFSIKRRLEKLQTFTVTFQCYMVELYLDKLQDLLIQEQQGVTRPKLELREDPDTGMINILNVTMHGVSSLEEARQIYQKGVQQRKTSSTAMNDTSSRSHFVFTLIAHTFNKTTNQRTSAKISFVDLAGSERINKSNTNIKQLQEAIKINKSLTALKDVIRALSQGTSSQFVPYRNNKLTELMRDSIGGNSKTLMFVNISPADYNSQESQMSLFFGCDAKQIKNDVHKNVETQEMARLKEQIDQLKKMLMSTQKQPSILSGEQKTLASINQFGNSAYGDISINRSGAGKFSNSISSNN